MARTRRLRILPPLILVATGLLAATYFMKPAPTEISEVEAAEHLTNRVWINRMPKNSRDVIRTIAIQKQKKENKHKYGVARAGSNWRTLQDVFLYTLKGTKIEMQFPQENKKVSLNAKTFTCNVKPFDLCLELSAGKRVLKLYSKKKWTFDQIATERPPELSGVVNFADYDNDNTFDGLPANACDDCIYGTPQWFLEAAAEL